MKLQTIVVGELEVNCYLLAEGGEAIVIDPGDEYEKIIAAAEKENCKIIKILLTHGHFDHIGAVSDIAEKTGAKVYVHKDDEIMLDDNIKNLAEFSNAKVKHCKADFYYDSGDVIELGTNKLKIHHTPGHSAGGVCIECGEYLFSGDLLFAGSIGRFDRGDLRTELKSLKYLIDNFSDDIVVYPGHGSATTIGDEKAYNPYIINHVMMR